MITTPMKYEKVDVAIKNEKQKGYQIDIDSLNRRSVKIHFFKGVARADMDRYTSGKLVMVRLLIQFVGDLSKYIPIDGLVSKNLVESLDIEFYLIEHFLHRKMEKNHVTKFLSIIWEMCKFKNIGDHVGSITIDYAMFTQFVNYLQYLSFETFKKEDVL